MTSWKVQFIIPSVYLKRTLELKLIYGCARDSFLGRAVPDNEFNLNDKIN
jgi:hypothetical protein